MIIKGFKVGMLLQLALGPITILVMQITLSSGYLVGMKAVLGVFIGDSLYVLAAILGVGAIINQHEKTKEGLSVLGAVIMFLFGGLIIIESLGLSLLPTLNLTSSGSDSAFFKAFFLTVANPMTIVFWAGVFAAKMVEEKMDRKAMYLFACGAVLSTLLAQSLVVMTSASLRQLMTPSIMKGLNLMVGLILVYGGLQLLLKKDQPRAMDVT